MSMPVKSKAGSQNVRRRNLIIVSLLVVVLVVSLCVYVFVVNNDDVSGDVVHVKSEAELVKAINAVNVGESVVITVDNDIQLSTELKIPAYKEVTLINNKDNQFRIIGAENANIIEVEQGGTLTINGLCIAHKKGANGAGVLNYGIFNMQAGEISGNALGVDNYGTFNMYGGYIINNVGNAGMGVQNIGVFNMYNGEISNNHSADENAGGAGVSNLGSFTMHNGLISNNQAVGLGSGVSNYGDAFFEMLDGEISGNTSYRSGGGVATMGIFKMSGGIITGNTATRDGGGVYIWPYTDDAEFIMTGGMVTGNTASNGPNVYPE